MKIGLRNKVDLYGMSLVLYITGCLNDLKFLLKYISDKNNDKQ